MKGGKKPKQRGTGFEYRVVREAQKLGHKGARVPASGAAKHQDFKHDVIIEVSGEKKRGQCKKTGEYKSIRIDRDTVNLLKEEVDFVAFALNQTPICVIIPFKRYMELEAGT